MQFASVVLAAAAAAQAHWVPLNSREARQQQGHLLPPPSAGTPASAPAPEAAAAPVSNIVSLQNSIPNSVTPSIGNVPTGSNWPLQITCLGGGTANKLAVANAYSSGSFSGMAGTTIFNGSSSGTTTVVGKRQQDFSEQVDVRLFSGDDRIRLPRTMLPPIHGGDAGWFKLKNVVADAHSIRASAAINFMSNPKVYIDRVTGTISISGRAGDFTGQCQAIPGNSAPKF